MKRKLFELCLLHNVVTLKGGGGWLVVGLLELGPVSVGLLQHALLQGQSSLSMVLKAGDRVTSKKATVWIQYESLKGLSQSLQQ